MARSIDLAKPVGVWCHMTRLKTYYRDVIVKDLAKKNGYASVMQTPKLVKVTLNMGVGEAVGDKKVIEHAMKDMTLIAGQKPIVTLAKSSIAGFKVREGWPVGCKVTLRRSRMYDFLDRLIHIVLPRMRDFRGLNAKSFDGRGNYMLGIKEQIVFPEIEYDKIDSIRGLDICITTTAMTDAEAKDLLTAFRFPFRN